MLASPNSDVIEFDAPNLMGSPMDVDMCVPNLIADDEEEEVELVVEPKLKLLLVGSTRVGCVDSEFFLVSRLFLSIS